MSIQPLRSKREARLDLKGAELHFEICRMRELQLLAVQKLASLDMSKPASRTLLRRLADLLIATERGTDEL